MGGTILRAGSFSLIFRDMEWFVTHQKWVRLEKMRSDQQNDTVYCLTTLEPRNPSESKFIVFDFWFTFPTHLIHTRDSDQPTTHEREETMSLL